MKTRTINIPENDSPNPEATEADKDLLVTLLDLVEQGMEPTSILGSGGATPWIAWQVGIFSEHFGYKSDYFLSYIKLSVQAALLSNDRARIFANLLSAGNVFLKRGLIDDSDLFCTHLLSLPEAALQAESKGATLGLANINFERQSYVDAAYFYDKVIRQDDVVQSDAGRNILSFAARSYSECSDLGGALYWGIIGLRYHAPSGSVCPSARTNGHGWQARHSEPHL